MTSFRATSLPLQGRGINVAVGVGVFVLIVIGFFWTDSAEKLSAYLYVTLPAVLPAALWFRKNNSGIPMLPIACGFYYIYYAVPILRDNTGYLHDFEIERASVSVGSFLLAACVTWWIVSYKRVRRSAQHRMAWAISDALVVRIVLIGLVGGVVFQVAFVVGALDYLGSALGVVRSLFVTAASVACFLMGYARARRLFYGMTWPLALGSFLLLLMFQLVGLFLVGAMVYYVAAAFGYIITSRRIPWKQLFLALALISFLHVGKGVMRQAYWAAHAQSGTISLTEIPELFGTWFVTSTRKIITGDFTEDQGLIDRASLLILLARVQRATPEHIPYLEGETYALLPSMLVPRFLNPDKIRSQAALAMLNVRYGFQTEEGTENTTIGWGLIAEAFANFGNEGAIFIGLIYGALCGIFTRMSIGASPVSLPSLLAIAAMSVLINLEADLAYMLTNLWQALLSVVLFFVPIRLLLRKQAIRSLRPARELAALRVEAPDVR